MATPSIIRAVQGHAIASDANTAVVALYGYMCGGPETPVVAAARRELTDAQQAHMATWLDLSREQVAMSAAVLDAVTSALPTDPFPPVPAEAAAYRTAAEELALEAGASPAEIAWSGVAAVAKWVRLYGGRVMDLREALTDPVAVAALGELGLEAGDIATMVGRDWERIDERVSATT